MNLSVKRKWKSRKSGVNRGETATAADAAAAAAAAGGAGAVALKRAEKWHEKNRAGNADY